MTETGTDPHEFVGRRIEDWRRRLIDLSHRNRLIAYKATKVTTLEIAAPSLSELLADPDRPEPWDFLLPPEPEENEIQEGSDATLAVEEVLLRSQQHHVQREAKEIELTETSPRRIARILDNLAKRSNTEFQDKALRILYIAAGFLDSPDVSVGQVTRPGSGGHRPERVSLASPMSASAV